MIFNNIKPYKMSNFSVPIAMEVTQKQYFEDLKDGLQSLGYRQRDINGIDIGFNYLVTYFNHYSSYLGTLSKPTTYTKRYVIEKYNPQLFLALAAMTEGEDWIVGEYLVYMPTNQIFKCTKLEGVSHRKGYADNLRKDLYRKATKAEIIEYFDREVIAKQYEQNISKQNDMNKDKRFPFHLETKDAKKIIEIACSEWKEKLAKKWGYNITLDRVNIVTKEQYQEMRNECNSEQHLLFNEIFGVDEKVLAKDTACLVSQDGISYSLRFADGKGEFYINGLNYSPNTVKWSFVHVLSNQDNLPTRLDPEKT